MALDTYQTYDAYDVDGANDVHDDEVNDFDLMLCPL